MRNLDPTRRGPSGGKRSRVEFGFIPTEGFSLLAFSCFVEALRQLEDHGARCDTSFCAWRILGSRPLRSSCHVPLSPTADWVDGDDSDFIVVIGGRRSAVLEQGAIDLLHRAARRNRTIVALDTSTFSLARLGLFRDRKYCIHWFHYGEFIEEFPSLQSSADSIFHVDGNFISCAGGVWAADLAVHLVTTLWSEEDGQRAVALMGMERVRSATHFQVPFLSGAPVVRDQRVARAIQLVERNCGNPPTLGQMSAAAGVSKRQMERLFVEALGIGPLQCSMTIRLRFGHWLLTQSVRPLSRVAADCGFADQSHFTRRFREVFGVTPLEARRGMRIGTSSNRFQERSFVPHLASELQASDVATQLLRSRPHSDRHH